MSGPQAYNPLEKLNLAKSIVEALFRQPARPLSEVPDIVGAGVYALYYAGDFELYRPIARMNVDGQFMQPIYVGKAIPRGGRRGGLNYDAAAGDALRSRIRKHAVSLGQAENLSINDFFYRSLVVDDVWIPLGENAIIEWYKPLWNLAIGGFGINDPGRGRAGQRRSEWDTLHSGRGMANSLPANDLSIEELAIRVSAFLAGDAEAIAVETPLDENASDD